MGSHLNLGNELNDSGHSSGTLEATRCEGIVKAGGMLNSIPQELEEKAAGSPIQLQEHEILVMLE